MPVVFVGIGSNLGDRNLYIQEALHALNSGSFKILKKSPIYETEPEDCTDQPKFLNMVIGAETSQQPLACLQALQHVENKMGRTRPFKNAARTIDLDILLYNSVVYNTITLVIPHPRLAERSFILLPLSDIAPEFRHPTLKKTIKELLSLVDTSGVRPWSPA